MITINLGTVEDLLPQNFYRISRFHVINTDFLIKVDRKTHVCILSLDGANYELPVNYRNIRGLKEAKL